VDDRACIQCGEPIGHRRRSDAVFCRPRCQRRYARRPRSSNYLEPPLASTAAGPGVLAGTRADDRFRAQYEQHVEAEKPLTPIERSWLAQQKRNPGVLIEPLRQIQIARAIEQQRREAESYRQHQPFAVQDPIHNPDPTVVARRGRASRQANKPVDHARSIMRPLDRHPGPHPWDDEPECITAPWSRGRW
jgi:hypothetical protein